MRAVIFVPDLLVILAALLLVISSMGVRTQSPSYSNLVAQAYLQLSTGNGDLKDCTVEACVIEVNACLVTYELDLDQPIKVWCKVYGK